MKKDKTLNKPSYERKGMIKNYTQGMLLGCAIVIILLIAALCYLVYKGNHPKLNEGKQVVASIEGKDFVAEELYKELNSQGGYNVLTNMVNKYIIDKEVEDTTEAKKYADSVVVQYEEQYKSNNASFKDAVINSGYESIDEFKKAIMDNYLYTEVAKKYIKEEITDKELKEYYEAHVSDELGVKHILIAPETKDDATSDEKKKFEEEALKKAKEIIKKLDDGEDFETLAKENSDDKGSASNGGVINNVVKDNYITEFWNAALKLENGKYTKEPVKSKFGYHIILKVSQTPKKSFDEMKDSLYDKVLTAKTTDDASLIEKTWLEIHKKYKLDIQDTTIQRVYDANAKSLNKIKPEN